MAQNKQQEAKCYNYYYKKYDFTSKTYEEILAEHPYVTQPEKAIGKNFLF